MGPIWHGGNDGKEQVLERAYMRCFELARAEPRIRTIAFPAISTGVYGFPPTLAAPIALRVMRENESAFDRVVACLFSAEAACLYRDLEGK